MNISKKIKNSLLLWSKTGLTGSFILGIMVVIGVIGMTFPQTTIADFANTTNASYVAKNTNEVKQATRTIKVMVTAYSSSWDETTGIPGMEGVITASGKNVADGIMANNLLPFGTKVKIPKLYGDKIFIIEDRMNKKKGNYHVDIWMPSKALAVNFGARTAEIEVLVD
jgi:3D (Asp-Asp-Asp) domain-containing protein